jgi:hypothetical protein
LRNVKRRRPSPALVIATIALFMAIGGIGYAAATIGTSDIKNNAVTAKKLHKNAVVKKKIKNNAVNGAKVQDNSLTGSDINESTLGQVPSAANADNATNAGNAGTVNGSQIVQFSFNQPAVTGLTELVSLSGVSLKAGCDAGPSTHVTLTANQGGFVESASVDIVTANNTDNRVQGEPYVANTPLNLLNGVTAPPTSADDQDQSGHTSFVGDDGTDIEFLWQATNTATNCQFSGEAIGG